MPFLVLYKELALLDSMFGLILIYALMVLPIVIWIMRDQFDNIPNELEQAALLTSTHAKTLPVMVASQTGSQGISWWSMAAVSSTAILPLIIIGIFLERFIVKGLTAGAVK